MTAQRPHRLLPLRLFFTVCAAAVLAGWLAAVVALLPPSVTSAGLWGTTLDFLAPTAAQARAAGWVSFSEKG